MQKENPEPLTTTPGEPQLDVSAQLRPKQPNCSGFVADETSESVANVMKPEKRVQILRLLAEGNSVRSTARLMQTNIPTVLRQLVKAGEECRQFLHDNLVEIKARHVQLDEIWTYCGKHQRRLAPEEQGNPALGDQFLFIALDTDTKLVCNYAIGKRDMVTTRRFLDDLSRRLVIPTLAEVIDGAKRPQVSSDAFHSYRDAMAETFGRQVTYGQLVKKYGDNPRPAATHQRA